MSGRRRRRLGGSVCQRQQSVFILPDGGIAKPIAPARIGIGQSRDVQQLFLQRWALHHESGKGPFIEGGNDLFAERLGADSAGGRGRIAQHVHIRLGECFRIAPRHNLIRRDENKVGLEGHTDERFANGFELLGKLQIDVGLGEPSGQSAVIGVGKIVCSVRQNPLRLVPILSMASFVGIGDARLDGVPGPLVPPGSFGLSGVLQSGFFNSPRIFLLAEPIADAGA